MNWRDKLEKLSKGGGYNQDELALPPGNYGAQSTTSGGVRDRKAPELAARPTNNFSQDREPRGDEP